MVSSKLVKKLVSRGYEVVQGKYGNSYYVEISRNDLSIKLFSSGKWVLKNNFEKLVKFWLK